DGVQDTDRASDAQNRQIWPLVPQLISRLLPSHTRHYVQVSRCRGRLLRLVSAEVRDEGGDGRPLCPAGEVGGVVVGDGEGAVAGGGRRSGGGRPALRPSWRSRRHCCW